MRMFNQSPGPPNLVRSLILQIINASSDLTERLDLIPKYHLALLSPPLHLSPMADSISPSVRFPVN